MRGTLRLLSTIAGIACLLDCAWEGLSGGRWHSYTGIYPAYYMMVGAYAGSREVEKWTDPAAAGAFWGEYFVAGWGVLAVLIWFLNAMNFRVVWPTPLNDTLKYVLGIFVTGKASGHWRSYKVGHGWFPGGAPAGGSAQDGDDDAAQAVIAACQKLKDFAAKDVARETGLSLPVVNGHLGRLVRDGRVRKSGNRFQWIG
jgi:hypothetical protein